MKAQTAFVGKEVEFVPPERVMTRLMREADERDTLWDYGVLMVFTAGFTLGILLRLLLARWA